MVALGSGRYRSWYCETVPPGQAKVASFVSQGECLRGNLISWSGRRRSEQEDVHSCKQSEKIGIVRCR